MAQRSCWVIIAGQRLTAFRAKQPQVLLPTLRQLQRTQPDAVMKWFDGVRFWDSPAAANAARRERKQRARPSPDWRPGGEHKDPRAKYKLTRDQKRARFRKRQQRQADEPRAGRRAGSARKKGPR